MTGSSLAAMIDDHGKIIGFTFLEDEAQKMEEMLSDEGKDTFLDQQDSMGN
jgi:hypothetical protein